MWLFWRDHPDREGRQGVACRIWTCTNPDCPCTDVVGLGRWIDDRVAAVRMIPNDPELRLLTAGERETDDPAYGCCAFRWDRVTGKVTAERGPAHAFAELAAWLEREFDDELRASLERAVVRGRQREPAADLWADWRPGTLVAFDDHFPDERLGTLDVHGAVFLVNDLHCIAPACPCTDVRFVFIRCSDDGSKIDVSFAGTFVVELPDLAPQDLDFAEDCPGGERGLLAVWRQFTAAHPDLAAVLARRRQRMKQVRPPARRGARAPAGPARRRERPGRNDRCPCGSGRKYKNCCGAG